MVFVLGAKPHGVAERTEPLARLVVWMRAAGWESSEVVVVVVVVGFLLESF